MKVLIIGGSGQDAFYLATFLGTSHVSIVWLYRNSIDSYLPYLDSQNIVLFRLKDYSFESMLEVFKENEFDSCVLISGAVGNQYAREFPGAAYYQNITIVHNVASLIQQYSPKAHLYYFSSVDVDGSRSSSGPIIFNANSSAGSVSTTYGLSKLHASQYLQLLHERGVLSCTILYLGMHESFFRKGDYVLTKIKNMVSESLVKDKIQPKSFGNLNIELDIGFARDYMSLVGQLVVHGESPKHIAIGTGVYTNLYRLCLSILDEFGLNSDYLIVSNNSERALFYPLVPFSCVDLPNNNDGTSPATKPQYLAPPPLDSAMLKFEYSSLVQRE